MAKVLMAAWGYESPGEPPPNVSVASTQSFVDLSGSITSFQVLTANENQCQLKIPVNGTLRNMRVMVGSNARTTNTVFTLRKNGANGNQTVTFGSGISGALIDNVNIDVVVAGDLIDLGILTGLGAQQLTIFGVQIEFEAVAGTVVCYAFNFCNNNNSNGFAGKNFFPVDGSNFRQGWGGGTGDNVDQNRCYIQTPGNITNLRAFVVANSLTPNGTITLYKNGVATTLTVVPPAGPAAIEDTTHSVAVIAGDYIQLVIDTTGRTAGTIAVSKVSMVFTSSGTTWTMFRKNIRNEVFGIGTFYIPPQGASWLQPVQAVQQLLATFAVQLTRLQTSWQSVTPAGDTLTVTVNGSGTPLTITFPTFAAGASYSDLTHLANVAQGGLIALQCVCLGGSSMPEIGSLAFDNNPPPPPPPYGPSMLLTGVG